MKKSPAKLIRLTVAVAGTGGMLLLAWRYLSWEVLRDTLSSIRIAPLAAAVLIYTGVTLLRGLRFIIIGANIRCTDAFSIAAVHAALLRVMPLRSGELAYGILLKRTGGGNFGEGMAAILVLRLLDLAVMLTLAAVVANTYFSALDPSHFAIFVALGAGVLTAAFFVAGPAAQRIERRIGRRDDGRRTPVWLRIFRTVSAALQMSVRRRFLLMGATLGIWALMIGWFYSIMGGADMNITTGNGVSVAIFGLVGSILPLAVVGSFGPMEGGFAVGLTTAGFSPETAAAQAVVISTFALMINWLVAVPAWIWLSVKNRRQP